MTWSGIAGLSSGFGSLGLADSSGSEFRTRASKSASFFNGLKAAHRLLNNGGVVGGPCGFDDESLEIRAAQVVRVLVHLE